MKKIFVFILVLMLSNIAFSQKTVTNVPISASISGLVYDNNSNTYGASTQGPLIGQYYNYIHYVLCVIDLESQLGGLASTVTSGSVTLSLNQLYGYNGSDWTAGFITTDISNASPQTQIVAIRAMGGTTAGNELTSITLSFTMSKIVSNKLIIGVKRQDNANRQEVASCSGLFSGTVRESATLTISYNQGTGNIVAYKGSTYLTPAAPAQVKAYENDQITIGALTSSIPNYQMVYNENQAPLNKSEWKKMDGSGAQISTLNPASNTFSLLKSEDGWKYEAQMKKLCNATFISNGGTVYVDGNSYSSPRISPVVEQNSVYAFATNYTANGLDYTFTYWDNSPSSNTITVTAHGTYTAAFTSKPSIVYRNQQVTSSIGQQITLTWNANPNPNLTAYRVYRKIGHSGTGSLIGSTSNTTFTDPDYIMTGSSEDTYLMYDVRPYIFQTESDPYFESAVFGRGGLESILEDKLIVTNASDMPSTYSITNFPNPFNPTTTINYQLPENGFVTIKVYDMLGKEIATLVNENKSAGYYKVTFDAGRLTSGIYIYTINAGKYTQSKKMLLMK